MAVSFLGILVLAGFAGLVFLALLGLIALLTNPRTRDTAKVLLGGLTAMVLLVTFVGGLFLLVARHRSAVSTQNAVVRAQIDRELARLDRAKREIDLQEAASAPATEVAVTPPMAAMVADAAEEKPAESPPVEEPADAAKAESAESGDGPTTSGEGKAAPKEGAEEKPLMPEEPEPSAAVQAEASQDAVASSEMKVEAEAANETPAEPAKPDTPETGELSVPPLADNNRPTWVDRKPYKEGSVYYWPVATDPSPDSEDAEAAALPKALNVAVADYIKNKLQLGAGAAGQVRLKPDYLRSEMVGDDIWIEPLSLSVGNFVRVHALVKFDRQANQVIHQQWQQQRVTGRLWSAAGLFSAALLFMALVYCYLKIDLVTGGSRRGLLRIAAVLVILGLMLVAVGVAVAGIA